MVIGVCLIAAGLGFGFKNRGTDNAGLQFFKINVSGAAWLILVVIGSALIGLRWWYDTEHVNDEEPFKEPPASVLTSEPDPASFIEEEGPGDEPFTYGDDEALDLLWDECQRGVMQSCDDLYQVSPLESEYEYFGGTCGMRNEEDPPEFCEPAAVESVPTITSDF